MHLGIIGERNLMRRNAYKYLVEGRKLPTSSISKMEVVFTTTDKGDREMNAHAYKKVSSCIKSFCHFTKQFYQLIVIHCSPFLVQLCYFISLSLVGALALKVLKPKGNTSNSKSIDLLFMSVSALTVSSMSTVEMEVFSNPQLWVLILLMIIGGEIFTSMVGLQFMRTKFTMEGSTGQRINSVDNDVESPVGNQEAQRAMDEQNCDISLVAWSDIAFAKKEQLNYAAVKYTGYVVLAYLVILTVGGSILVFLYLNFVSDARYLLRSKGIQAMTFAVFTTVSSVGNCGFTPANENMMIFRKNSTLLLLIGLQVLAGNTLFPVFLRVIMWFLKKATRREEFSYVLQNSAAARYKHFLPSAYCMNLTLTVFGFILVQLLLFCTLEWDSEGLQGMNSYQKAVGILFQSVNSRHAGESITDLSSLSPGILVLYVIMMYLPPYTSFLPSQQEGCTSEDVNERKGTGKFLQNLILSQLSYLSVFIILICITERRAFVADPLNFNVFNVVFEVISAYGNVGFSLGYSCGRLLKPDGNCKDAWTGFAGRWSNQGKVVLIAVMIFGRLKKFNMEGGKAWKLR